MRKAEAPSACLAEGASSKIFGLSVKFELDSSDIVRFLHVDLLSHTALTEDPTSRF